MSLNRGYGGSYGGGSEREFTSQGNTLEVSEVMEVPSRGSDGNQVERKRREGDMSTAETSITHQSTSYYLLPLY
jgi:hypothetical protein